MISAKVTAVLITREAEWPDDILMNFGFDETLIETRCAGVHRRFALAAAARNEHVYVQDDDCVIDIGKLFELYDGQRVTHAITQGHHDIYRGTGCTLIGWGCFFPKRLVDFSRWNAHYGEGTIPTHEYDRVFTYLAQPHRSVVMPIRHITRSRAMSRDNPEHYRSRDEIIRRLQALPEVPRG